MAISTYIKAKLSTINTVIEHRVHISVYYRPLPHDEYWEFYFSLQRYKYNQIIFYPNYPTKHTQVNPSTNSSTNLSISSTASVGGK